MTTKTTWNIDKLNYMTEDQYVYSIDYTVSAKDDKYPEYESKYSQLVELKKPDTLVPYRDITKETAIKWLQDRITELKSEDNKRNLNIEEIEQHVVDELKYAITPKKLSGIPWD